MKRIAHRMRTLNLKTAWNKAYLKFAYTAKYHNEAVVTNLKDFDQVYSAFYELTPEFKPLLIKNKKKEPLLV